MKKISFIAASTGLVVLMGASSAFASPTGPYIDVMGGGSYLLGSKISGLQVPQDPTGQVSGQFDDSSFGFTGRAAAGYYFNKDPLNSWAFGLEAGYNYFLPYSSSLDNSIVGGTALYGNGSAKTSAWASDLDFIVSEDISENVSLLYKIGVGYESKETKFKAEVPNTFYQSADKTISQDGFGLVGGLGMQYAFSKNFALRAEIDGMKGGKDIGYAQGLLGLVWMF